MTFVADLHNPDQDTNAEPRPLAPSVGGILVFHQKPEA